MKTRKLSIWRILATVALAFFTFIMIVCTLGCISNITYYGEAYKEAVSSLAGSTEVLIDEIPGKPALETELAFDKNCYVNQKYSYQEGSEYIAAGKALYDKTHLQLYCLVLDAPVGPDTDIKNETDAQHYCEDFIKTLPNEDIAIITYEFRGDEVNGKWITLYDKMYYGDTALEYLSISDMAMIQYILQNDYDLFPDYSTRSIREWETIASNIADGYNQNLYNGTVHNFSDWDVTYYKEQLQSAKVMSIVFGGLSALCIIGFVVMFYVNFILHPRAVRAEIETEQAKATRIILEAKVDEMPDEADALADKYLGSDE